MSYHIRFTPEAKSDVERLYRLLVKRDPRAAERALEIIERGWSCLEEFHFSCRQADHEHRLLRELIIPFGGAGYVALFEINDHQTVTILAIRHQREDDYP
ncbi:MAG: type II toxin-antitoxin system RelE/ParE family toxin [Wenzhouxiangella sp.]|jgi:plasmid stabilization system protein ParE|nr:type II toxin-antitoxin system RelE/ParE family toxin [Wenzhouxiangella sp.]